jgi:hypothetical protein
VLGRYRTLVPSLAVLLAMLSTVGYERASTTASPIRCEIAPCNYLATFVRARAHLALSPRRAPATRRELAAFARARAHRGVATGAPHLGRVISSLLHHRS